MSFNFSLFFIQQELGQMSRYLDIVVVALETNFKSVDTAYEEAMNEQIPHSEDSDDYVDWLIGKHEDQLIEAGEDFPQLLLVSFVILWYSFVEQKLLNFCDELGLSIPITPKSNENFGRGIRRAYKFLSDAKSYKIEASQWEELVLISKLRNLVVHEGKEIALIYAKPEGQFVPYKMSNGLEVYIPIDTGLFSYVDSTHKCNFEGRLER